MTIYKSELNTDGRVVGIVAMEPIRATTLSFFDGIHIHADGRVEIDPKYETTEAARAFWRAVREVAPEFFGAAQSSEGTTP